MIRAVGCVRVEIEVRALSLARTHQQPRGLVVLVNQVLVVVERELYKVPDPSCLAGLDLLLVGLVT